jgi:competence protein ComEA
MDNADDVLARLRLRAQLTDAARAVEAPDAGVGTSGGDGRKARHLRKPLVPASNRFAVSRGAVIGVAIAAVLLVAIIVVPRVVAGRAGGTDGSGAALALDATPSAVADRAGGGAGAESPAPASAVPVVVYVTGCVRTPGVLALPPGSRVTDALEGAGGALPEADLTVLNLAAVVADGERIFVPTPGQTPPAVLDGGGGGSGSGASGGGGAAGGAVNVNTAGAAELTALPGIGPVLAQRIVDYREAHGPFASVADLGGVTGIGPSLMDSLADLVVF